MASPIHAARQAKADIESALHSLKSEGRKLVSVKDRTADQDARLTQIEHQTTASLKCISRASRRQTPRSSPRSPVRESRSPPGRPG